MTHAASTNGSATAALPAREMGRFLAAYRREHATTEKVLRAFPRDQSEFRPHERSSSARQLAWTFVVEQVLMLRVLRKEQLLTGGGFPPAPESWDEILGQFARNHAEIVRVLEAGGTALVDGTVQFFVAPKQVGDIPAEAFLWFMLHDQIHHRGQLSVYVRMAGGKVPSIYGPSADEPWS